MTECYLALNRVQLFNKFKSYNQWTWDTPTASQPLTVIPPFHSTLSSSVLKYTAPIMSAFHSVSSSTGSKIENALTVNTYSSTH